MAHVKLVTVHGTGAGADSATGSQWWQLGSPFQKELEKRIDLDPSSVEVVPFQWGHGPNSEHARREAGRALLKQLKAYDKAGEDYYLIGHSHGGSVIYNMLMSSVARRKPLERLKSWTTVGTPFLDFQANRWLYQRLGNIGFSLWLTAMTALFLTLAIVILAIWGDRLAGSASLTDDVALGLVGLPVVALPFALVCLIGLYIYDRFADTWHTDAQRKACADQYGDRWTGFWHRNDEAISALVNVKGVSGPIIPSTFLVSVASGLPVLLMLAMSFYLFYDILFLGGESASQISWTANSLQTQFTDWGLGGVTAFTLAVTLMVFGYLLIFYLAALIFKVIARLLGWPLSHVINGLIWSSIRQRAWGDDQLKEAVNTAGSKPPGFDAGPAPLPEAIAKPLGEHSERHAILTLTKVRQVLGMADEPQRSPNMMAELSENLNWEELIHTSYFAIPEFVDLIACALHQQGMGALDSTYWQTTDQAAVNQHLASIKGVSGDATKVVKEKDGLDFG